MNHVPTTSLTHNPNKDSGSLGPIVDRQYCPLITPTDASNEFSTISKH